MNLTKQSYASARWNHEANQWWVGESITYQWTDSRNRPVSGWMNFDNALLWIKEHDENKETNQKTV